MDLDASFGHWLTLRRKALRLTQTELAGQVGCAVVTLRKIEADARRPSRQIAEKLASRLAVPAEEQELFVKAARGELRIDRLSHPNRPVDAGLSQNTGIPLRPIRASPPISLFVPPTPLLGRAQEVAVVRNYMLSADVRLLTLTGAPGIGKTRLALQVATELQDAFSNRVAFIPLAPIHDPSLVIPTIAQTLGIPEGPSRPVLDRLKGYLRDQQLLLVLDNFEQVLAAAPQLADLLAVALRLKLLITSRAALHLSAEHRFPVPALALPNLDRLAREPNVVAILAQYAAVNLFVQRARAVMPTFELTDANAWAVAEICHRLDGLPLAIELAAARVTLFAPRELLNRLDHRLALLTGGALDMPARQQTLGRAIDWSYDLLSEAEQTLLRQLGVFVGGCTLEAGEAVCRMAGDLEVAVLDSIAALVDHSLLRCEERTDGGSRFTLLEMIHEYALERLAESGELETLRRRHAEYYLALAEAAEQLWDQPEEGAWLQRLAVEHANLRAALQWALDSGEAEYARRLNAALLSFWCYCSDLNEANHWMEVALAMPCKECTPVAIAAEAKVLNAVGYVAAFHGDHTRAQARFEKGLALYGAIGDKRAIAWSLRGCGFAAMLRGDLARAEDYDEQSLALCQEAQDWWGIAWSLYDLGYLALAQGDNKRARVLLEEGLARLREQGITFGVFRARFALGHVLLGQADVTQAKQHYQEGLMLQRQLRFQSYTADGLEGLAGVAVAQGQLERAARLFGAAEALREALGWRRWVFFQESYDRAVATTHARLGEKAWAAAWLEGRAMSLEQAAAYALED